MKLDAVYRLGFYELHIKASGIKVKDDKAFAKLSIDKKVIPWRFLIWRLAAMLCVMLDIQLPKLKMVNLKKGL